MAFPWDTFHMTPQNICRYYYSFILFLMYELQKHSNSSLISWDLKIVCFGLLFLESTQRRYSSSSFLRDLIEQLDYSYLLHLITFVGGIDWTWVFLDTDTYLETMSLGGFLQWLRSLPIFALSKLIFKVTRGHHYLSTELVTPSSNWVSIARWIEEC